MNWRERQEGVAGGAQPIGAPEPGEYEPVDRAGLEPYASAIDSDEALGLSGDAGRSQWRLAWHRFLHHRVAVASTIFLILLTLACFVGPQFVQSSTSQDLLNATSGPSGVHWFGTDELSRDEFARVLQGGQVSLMVGFGVAILSTIIGVIIGAFAGFYGGWLDSLLMRWTDLWLALPALPFLALAQTIGVVTIGPFSFALGSAFGITLILALLFWSPIARVVRGVILSLREKEFIEAGHALGASNFRIIFRHVLPNCVGPIIVNTTLVVAGAILTESALSFLGFGIQLPTQSWGNLLTNSVDTQEQWWWLTLFPGMAIFLTVLAINFIGDGLRDALDPKQQRNRA